VSAVVTGGASGIGWEVAGRLRDAGHDVVVWDRAGGDIECDISQPEAVSAAMGGVAADVAAAIVGVLELPWVTG
jgi:nucleoside-diphosphate-sugar epimerase